MKVWMAGLSALILGMIPFPWAAHSASSARSAALTAAVVQAQPGTLAQSRDTLTLTRVWAGPAPSYYATSPSPDGRYLTNINWITANLTLLDLQTGTTRDVTRRVSWVDSLAWAESSVFSPDGSEIAYARFSGKSGYEIWVINTDGADPHVLLPWHQDRGYFLMEDWSSDGRQLLVQSVGPGGVDLALVSTADGSFRTLGSLGYEYTSLAAFSPDDRYVAYTHPSGEGAEDDDVFAISVDDGRRSRLLAGPSDDQFMGWMPDGRSILFYSDREVTQGIWRAPVGPGLRVGEPELLRADVWRLIPLGFSRNAYFYGVPVEQSQVHTGAIDIGAGRILRSPTPVQDVSEGRSAAGDWSPDGRYLAYATTDPRTQGLRLVVRPVTGDGTREIPLALKEVRMVRWGPDSRTVMIVGAIPQLADALLRVDLAQGKMETILCFYGISAVANRGAVSDRCPAPVAEGVPHFVDFSPDGQTVYFARGYPFDGDARVVARDLTSGAERKVAAVRSLRNLSVSPDGRTLAMVDEDEPEQVNRLLTVPASGGEVRVLHTVEGPWGVELELGLPWTWTPDGRFLLFITRGDGVLWRIPTGGGEPQRLFRLPGADDYRHLRLHPDGSRIAYSTGQAKGEIWKIENLPGLVGSDGVR